MRERDAPMHRHSARNLPSRLSPVPFCQVAGSLSPVAMPETETPFKMAWPKHYGPLAIGTNQRAPAYFLEESAGRREHQDFSAQRIDREQTHVDLRRRDGRDRLACGILGTGSKSTRRRLAGSARYPRQPPPSRRQRVLDAPLLPKSCSVLPKSPWLLISTC